LSGLKVLPMQKNRSVTVESLKQAEEWLASILKPKEEQEDDDE